MVPGGGVEPPRAEARRILSTQEGSDWLAKFFTLPDPSTGYKKCVLIRFDRSCTVLNMELLHFYYSWCDTQSGEERSPCNNPLIMTMTSSHGSGLSLQRDRPFGSQNYLWDNPAKAKVA